MSKIIFIGAPETPAADFQSRIVADIAGADLLAVNDRAAAFPHLADTEVLIGHHFQFDEALISTAPKLRWVQSLTTGTDAILKIRALKPEVRVTSTRGMHSPQMSELVFLHMLSLNRNFPTVLRNQAIGKWERWPQPLLDGKTIVIVGVGTISAALAPRCKAFGMKVIGVSGTPRDVPGFDKIFGRNELHQAAALADFLVLIVPHSADTANMIDASVINAMKPSAYLINVARGGVLDEAALLTALGSKRIAGAGLDVFQTQPLPPDHPFWQQENIIITPLLGGMSDVYLDQSYPLVLNNLRCYLAGNPDQMDNLVKR